MEHAQGTGNLDRRDSSLIEALRANSRASVRELARLTKMRPSTVHVRLRKLAASGVIERFTVKLDNRLAGENFIVFVLVSTEGDIPARAFRDRHIREVFGVTGEYDLLLKMKFSDIEEFNRFILEFRKLPQVRKTHTLVATVALKEEI